MLNSSTKIKVKKKKKKKIVASELTSYIHLKTSVWMHAYIYNALHNVKTEVILNS